MLMHRQDGDAKAFACTNAEIPQARYTSRDFLALEYDRIFARSWQVAAREEEAQRSVPRPPSTKIVCAVM
jgi:hypothetical protein